MYDETNTLDPLPLFQQKLKFSDSILDIGCGLGVLLEYYHARVILGLEIHRPYLENRKFTSPHIIPIHADAMDMKKLFMPKSMSTVTFFDSLEHFTKQDGVQLLQMAEEIAKYRVIIFTPRGFFPQSNFDFYGLNGEKYQGHYSGWEVEEFIDLGYEITVFKDFHTASNPAFRHSFGTEHAPVDAILATKILK